jgi:hypothetical protein
MVELNLSFRCSDFCVTTATIKIQAGVAAGLVFFSARILRLVVTHLL